MIVNVLLNEAKDDRGRNLGYLDGYLPEHVLRLAHIMDVGGEFADDDSVLNETYRLLNVGDDPDFGEPDERAVAYRRKRNRSLSVGDVLILSSGRAYAVANVGFDRLGGSLVTG